MIPRPASPGRTALEFLLLGRPSVRMDGRPLAFSRRKAMALLCSMACRSEPLGRSAAAGLLWPESPPDRARQSLRQVLAEITASAGRPLLESDARFLSFAAGIEVTVDSVRFSALADRGIKAARDLLAMAGDGGDPRDVPMQEARSALSGAEALYRGEFLEGFYLDDSSQFEEWQLGESRRLVSLAASVGVALARLAFREGDMAEAEAEARKAIETAPFFELGHCILVEVLAAQGDRAAALRHAAEYGRTLQRELGHGLGPAFSSLVERIGKGEGRAGMGFAIAGETSQGRQPSPSPSPPPLSRFPGQATNFIGRGLEKEALVPSLVPGRLVTLVGPGGIGKTRLAIEAAGAAAGAFAEGAAFVDLVPCRRDEDVPAAIATALGMRLGAGGAASLPDHLAALSILLVLDNCEHVVEGAAASVSQIVASCPGLGILATSRERLGCPGESLFEVPPLGMPEHPAEGRAVSLEEALRTEAPRLFTERATVSAPGWSPAPSDAADMVEICAMLDGLPLAIELAAARVGTLGVGPLRRFLASRLTAPLELLDGGLRPCRASHRGLVSLFDWSWELLDGRERAAFSRLSVFRGSFPLEAAVAVCGAGTEPIIVSLADKRLIAAEGDQGGSARFRLLDTVKAYAGWRLAGSGEEENAQRAHVAWYSALLAGREDELRVMRSAEMLDGTRREIGEFLAATGYAAELTDLLPVAARMGRILADLFLVSGTMDLLGETLDAIRRRQAELGFGAAAADYHYALGLHLRWHSRMAEGRAELDEAARLYRDSGDRLMEGYALVGFGEADEGFRFTDPGGARAKRACSLFNGSGNTHGMAKALMVEGQSRLSSEGPAGDAEPELRTALAFARESGSLPLLAGCLMALARCAIGRHEYREAEEYVSEAEEPARALDDPVILGDAAFMRVSLESRQGRLQAGLDMAARCLEFRRRMGEPSATAIALRLKAAVLDLAGRKDEAVQTERSALELMRRDDNRDEIDFHRRSLALLDLACGDLEGACDIAEGIAAETLATPEGERRLENLLFLGEFHLFFQETELTLAACEEALRLATGTPLAQGARILMAAADPRTVPATAMIADLRGLAAAQDDDAALAATNAGLRLIEAGFSGPGLDLAVRGLAADSLKPPFFWHVIDRAFCARTIERLRTDFGKDAVDRLMTEATGKYASDDKGFFLDIEEGTDALERALVSAEGSASAGQGGMKAGLEIPRHANGPALPRPGKAAHSDGTEG